MCLCFVFCCCFSEYHWISGPTHAVSCTWPISGWAKFCLWSHREIDKVILRPPRSEAQESRDTGSAGEVKQLSPGYTMSCWWEALGFSVQGLSLLYYISFHKGQLITTLLWGTEEKNDPKECHWPFFVYKAHKGVDGVPLQQETICLREEERSAESAPRSCSRAQCFLWKRCSPNQNTVAYMDSFHFKRRNLKVINRDYTTLINNFKALSPLSFLESS